MVENSGDIQETGRPAPAASRGHMASASGRSLAASTQVSLKCLQLTNLLLGIYPKEKSHRCAIDD